MSLGSYNRLVDSLEMVNSFQVYIVHYIARLTIGCIQQNVNFFIFLLLLL